MAVGVADGSRDGSALGPLDGSSVVGGSVVGGSVGVADGSAVGGSVGASDGSGLGTAVGACMQTRHVFRRVCRQDYRYSYIGMYIGTFLPAVGAVAVGQYNLHAMAMGLESR